MTDVDVILADAKARRLQAATGKAEMAAVVRLLTVEPESVSVPLETREARHYDIDQSV